MQVLDALEKELKDLKILKKDVKKEITTLKKNRSKPVKKSNVGGRAHVPVVPVGVAIGHVIRDMMDEAHMMAQGRIMQRQREEARRREALQEQRQKQLKESVERRGRIKDEFDRIAKVRDLEAKYQRDKDAAIKASLEDFRKKLPQPQMMNNKSNNKKNNEKPGEPIVIDLASSAEKPNPNAGKIKAERRAKRECEAAEAKRRLEVATKNNVIDLDMLESQQSPPPPQRVPLFQAKPSSANRKRTASPANENNAKKKRAAKQSNSQEAIVLD